MKYDQHAVNRLANQIEKQFPPLDDPDYTPLYVPLPGGRVPLEVGFFGKSSQIRWFRRFGSQIRMTSDEWDAYWLTEHHKGLCCPSCIQDRLDGYDVVDEFCCCLGFNAAL